MNILNHMTETQTVRHLLTCILYNIEFKLVAILQQFIIKKENIKRNFLIFHRI